MAVCVEMNACLCTSCSGDDSPVKGNLSLCFQDWGLKLIKPDEGGEHFVLGMVHDHLSNAGHTQTHSYEGSISQLPDAPTKCNSNHHQPPVLQ